MTKVNINDVMSISEKSTQVHGRPEPLLTISRLNKSFDSNQFIKNFNLEIMPGEVMCLLGNNGSGKTTLINLLTGLCSPDKDKCNGDTSLMINGRTRVSLYRQKRLFRSYVRLCQQNDFLFEELTAREHL